MAVYQLMVRGKLDKYLQTTDADGVTFWRAAMKKHQPFALDSINQNFATQTAMGRQAQIIMNRSGDAMWYQYLHVKLPGIAGCDGSASGDCAQIAGGNRFPISDCTSCKIADDAYFASQVPGFSALTAEEQEDAIKRVKDAWRRTTYGAAKELGCCSDGLGEDCPTDMCPELDATWAHYVNDIGHALIREAKLQIGGTTVDTLWSTMLFAWEELGGKSGRRLTELTGRRYTVGQIFCDSSEERHLYIPLPFFYTLNSGSVLPLVAAMYHQVQIEIHFQAIEKLIVVSGENVAVRNAATGYLITANDLDASMETTYVFMSETEQAKFTEKKFSQLIVQHQHFQTASTGKRCRVSLPFNHPISEIIFLVRRQCNEDKNQWTNFSGVDGRDPIVKADLKLNSTSRFSGEKPAIFWRGVVPLQHHSNIPEAFLYCMSFATQPENTTMSTGSINFSKIDNVELVLDMQEALAQESVTIDVFARNWNLIHYEQGTAALAFT